MTRTMMMFRLFAASCCLLLTASATAHRYDRDTGTDCQAKAEKEYCIKDPDMFFDCPITCASHLRPTSDVHKGAHESLTESPVYEFQLRGHNGKTVDMDTYAGEILLIVLIPLYPGLAQFNYELLHHVVAKSYKYLVEAVVIPMEGQDGVAIEPLKESKMKLLAGANSATTNPLVGYLKGKIQEGKMDETKVNAFIINPNGNHIEMHVSPDMAMYKKYIDFQLQDLEEEF